MTSPGEDFQEVAEEVWVHRTARLDVEHFEAGRGTVVNGHARVFGAEVHLGRECWVDEYATIGGGSAFDTGAHLHAGAWLHLGNYSQVNIARGVTCGDEVGIGIGTRVFTHGAWLSEWDGYPAVFEGVSLGSRVWLPNALVNPGVHIGDDVVVAAGSIVSSDIPAGSMAAGDPAKVVRPAVGKAQLTAGYRARVLKRLVAEIGDLAGTEPSADPVAGTIGVEGAVFYLDERRVEGEATKGTETARNQLRRRGIRFRYEPVEGRYKPWE